MVIVRVRSSIAAFQRRYLRLAATPSTWVFIGALSASVILLSIVVGYFVGAGWTHESLEARLQAEIARQQRQSVEDSIARNVQLEVLARKVAMFEARLSRLDMLGARLVDLYGLKRDEFDFFDNPGVGGGSDYPGGTSAALSMDDLDERVKKTELQLRILREVISKDELLREMTPGGWPVARGWVSSPFGNRANPFNGRREFHLGVDIVAPEGTPVYALASGIVKTARKFRNYGHTVEIDHGKNCSTRYAHNLKNLVSEGEVIKQGDVIALVGNSGRSTGAHLHFELLKDGRQINPEKSLLCR